MNPERRDTWSTCCAVLRHRPLLLQAADSPPINVPDGPQRHPLLRRDGSAGVKIELHSVSALQTRTHGAGTVQWCGPARICVSANLPPKSARLATRARLLAAGGRLRVQRRTGGTTAPRENRNFPLVDCRNTSSLILLVHSASPQVYSQPGAAEYLFPPNLQVCLLIMSRLLLQRHWFVCFCSASCTLPSWCVKHVANRVPTFAIPFSSHFLASLVISSV